ncbi:hypothetical protein D3C80_1340370 [compost metagenome]
MSLETQIAALVSAANNLTGNVSGKIAEIDAALVAAGVTYNAQLEDLKNRLPRLLVTKNYRMLDADANGLPDNWGQHAEVTATKVRTISSLSEAAGRPAEDIALLAQIEADVREVYPDFDIRKSSYYRAAFNVWQYQWTQNASTGYLSYPVATDQQVTGDPGHLPLNSYVTVAGFVKVIEGGLTGMWANGATLGKWRWCSLVINPTKQFGVYSALHPMRVGNTGLAQVALCGAATGVISHPASWGAMLGLA